MIRRTHAALVAAALLVGCGAPQTPDTKSEPQPKTEKQRITNMATADLAVCFSKPPEVPAVVNKEILTGLLVGARSAVMECAVDPKNRGAAKETKITVKSAVGGGKVESSIVGENLSPEGQKCAEGAVSAWLAGVPNLASKVAAGSPPVAAEAQFQHTSEVSPTVILGVNEGSDIAATVRLAQPSWCDCYADWKDAAPRSMTAKIKLIKHAAEADGAKSVSPAEVTFEAPKDPAEGNVAACLQKKISAQKFTVTSEELTVPYVFRFLHSSFSGPLTDDASPDLRFAQLDGVRGQRAVDSLIAYGARVTAAMTYDDLVKKYKANPASVTVDDLKGRCGDLLKLDDAWIASIERQLDVDQKTLTLASELKAKDPQWERAVGVATAKVDETKKDLETAKKFKVGDEGACPKERK